MLVTIINSNNYDNSGLGCYVCLLPGNFERCHLNPEEWLGVSRGMETGGGGDVAGDRDFSVAADLANTWICG